MEADLTQMLEDVGYKGPLLESEKLSEALETGQKSVEFTGLVSWLCNQLATLNEIHESVHPTTSADDASSFLLELSFFLKELGCVNQQLTTGNVNQRLATPSERTVLLEYLITELMASKVLEVKHPKSKTSMEVTIDESDTAKALRLMLVALKFQKPPDNISPEMLFTRVENKLKEVVSQAPPDLVGKPMFFGELSTEQWNKLSSLQGELHKEYSIRREMLLKRLDVTVQSFLWSDRIKPQEDEVNSRYNAKREKIIQEPNVTIADLLAARDDLAIIEKTSSASVRKNTRSRVNTVIIGNVPDRGGRPFEQEPPPPEMPPWQKDRVPGPPSRGGGGRGGGGGRRGDGGGGSGGVGGRGGGGRGRGGGGYNSGAAYVDISASFAQNVDLHSGYNNRGNYQNNNRNSAGYQGGGYQRGGYQGGGHQGGGYQGGGYQGGGKQSGGYQDNRGGGYQRGGGGGRGGRVQGNWNQGGNNYQRGGYNRGGSSRW